MKRKTQATNNLTDYDWIGHGDVRADPGTDEALLVANREAIEVLVHEENPDSCYDYHNIALVCLHEKLYLLETSGCSCPSPRETWSVVCKPKSLSDAAKYIRKDTKLYLPDALRANVIAAIEGCKK